jgi:hypothetical protein
MNAETEKRVRAHGANLQRIFPATRDLDPLTLCRRVRRIERDAEDLFTRACCEEVHDLEEQCDRLESRLDALLRFSEAGVPVFLNRDPRGYALKIQDEWINEHARHFYQDWGGYGIIAPDLSGD